MNVYRAGLEDLDAAERRHVRRAISRGQRLADRRLAAACVRHADSYLADPLRYEAVNALVVALAAGLAAVVLSWVTDGLFEDAGTLLFFVVVMAAAQLLIGRPLRRSQFEAAKRRHSGERRS